MLKKFCFLASLFICVLAETLQIDPFLTSNVTNSTNQQSNEKNSFRSSRDLNTVVCIIDTVFKETYGDRSADVINEIKFSLRRKQKSDEVLRLNDKQRLAESGFVKSDRTVIITHGWFNTESSLAVTKISDAYLRNGENFNVISVDWSKFSRNIKYYRAAHKVKSVGQSVAKMINFLHAQGMDCSKLTLVGHSLGAHVMGIAGQNTVESCKVARVVGLDPARPYFQCAKSKNRISKESATFVELIHTNGQLLGLQEPMGHADFFINGGMSQPPCDDTEVQARLIKGSITDILKQAGILALATAFRPDAPKVICSHSLSIIFYAESINTEVGFYGKECHIWPTKLKNNEELASEECKGDFVQMGGTQTTPRKHGIFYLMTKNSPPFAAGRNVPETSTKKTNFSKFKDLWKTFSGRGWSS